MTKRLYTTLVWHQPKFCTHTHTHTHTYTYTHVHTHITHTHTYTHNTHIHTHTHIHVHMQIHTHVQKTGLSSTAQLIYQGGSFVKVFSILPGGKVLSMLSFFSFRYHPINLKIQLFDCLPQLTKVQPTVWPHSL